MADTSVFMDKELMPTDKDLAAKLGKTYALWKQLHDFVLNHYPKGLCEWNYGGKKFGWSYCIKDKKRAIVYLLPRDGFFKAAFVFGDAAVKEIEGSDIAPDIKKELAEAAKYAEGRGIRIDVKNDLIVEDIKKLVEVKLKH